MFRLPFDIKNNEVERPIDFYDIGIPGYTGKPKTQSERRLHEADAGKMIPSFGLGFSVNFYKLLNILKKNTYKKILLKNEIIRLILLIRQFMKTVLLFYLLVLGRPLLHYMSLLNTYLGNLLEFCF